MLHQAIVNVGQGVIKVLVLDRGFLDGETLWTLKHSYEVDFVIPSKDDMRVTTEARAFRQQKTIDQPLTILDTYDLRSLIENRPLQRFSDRYLIQQVKLLPAVPADILGPALSECRAGRWGLVRFCHAAA